MSLSKMTRQAQAHLRYPSRASFRDRGLRLAAVLIALAIFGVDILVPLPGAVAVLYVVVVLLAAKISRWDILAAAASTIALTVLAYVHMHGAGQLASPTFRFFVSLVALVIVTIIALENQRASAALRAQADLLDLSHDMIFVRDRNGTITFWNDGATACYGWIGSEARGRNADELLGTRYPTDRGAIEANLLRIGHWEGVLQQRTKAGSDILVESRWALRLDRHGRPKSVLETHRDVTEREASHRALAMSEERYKRIFRVSRVGLIQQDWSALRMALQELAAKGVHDIPAYLARHPTFLDEAKALLTVMDVNPAMLCMVGADSAKTFAGSVGHILSGAGDTLTDSIRAFAQDCSYYEGETELVTVTGEQLPVLFGLTFPKGEDAPGSDVLIFVVDLREREKAKEALLTAQSELAHAARVATLGELSASIAHEVNQPLAAIVTSGEAALRWLRRDVPDIGEVETALDRVIREGKRASAIVGRIRGFLTKTPARRKILNLAEIVIDAKLLVDRELIRHGVALRMWVEPDLPPVIGDRIQLQQVLVNLMVNGIQAMGMVPTDRVLTVRAERSGSGQLAITVGDTGPGFAAADLDRVFQPFFTTKKDGMGMGLAICRSTVEAHGGRLVATSEAGIGASFTFTLPVVQGTAA